VSNGTTVSLSPQKTLCLLTGKASEKLRINPRKAWYRNLEGVTANSDYEVTFRLKRPQPSFIALLASGFSPVYPCHVPPRDLRDGIEYRIIKNPSTGILSFVAGQVDMTSPYFLQAPLLKDVQSQDPQATCVLVPSNVNRNVMMNRETPLFGNPELRRAVALTIDRKAFVDTLTLRKVISAGLCCPRLRASGGCRRRC